MRIDFYILGRLKYQVNGTYEINLFYILCMVKCITFDLILIAHIAVIHKGRWHILYIAQVIWSSSVEKILFKVQEFFSDDIKQSFLKDLLAKKVNFGVRLHDP